MALALSHISVSDFQGLNELAMSSSMSSQKDLAVAISDLAYANSSVRMCGKAGWLVVGGQGIVDGDSYLKIEAILDFPEEMQHPVEQASACLALLRRPASEMPAGLKRTPQQIQRRLSQLLVRYPVLMHNKLVFAVHTPDLQWSSLPVAIAATAFASLPRLSDGLTSEQLVAFARNPSVKAGLTKPNPSFDRIGSKAARSVADTLANKSAIMVLTAINTFAWRDMHSSTQGGFLTSFLTLSDAARVSTGRSLLAPNVAATIPRGLYGILAKTVWDVVLFNGRDSCTSLEQLRDVLALPSPFAPDDSVSPSGKRVDLGRTVATARMGDLPNVDLLSTHMAFHLGSWLFAAKDKVPSDAGAHIGDTEMGERTQRVMAALVQLGLAQDMPAAGRWLADATVGVLRHASKHAPPATDHSTALGFLQALHAHGVTVTAPPQPAESVPAEMHEAANTWRTSIEVFGARTAMESVFCAHGGAQKDRPCPTPPSVPPAAPRPRAHRRLV